MKNGKYCGGRPVGGRGVVNLWNALPPAFRRRLFFFLRIGGYIFEVGLTNLEPVFIFFAIISEHPRLTYSALTWCVVLPP